jgi:prepilin-type N-terminal cleavage/methylation domain-containing protein
MNHSRIRHGFTLIELMIAVTLGSLIIYAAMAGFRVAAQTITVANRLSLENSLLRAGFQVALNEVDTWTSYDDPESSSEGDRALRLPNRPFSPLPALAKISTSESGGAKPAKGEFIYPSPETDKGWDHHYFWPPNDPRTWWRANAAEWHDTAGRSGKYSQFANTVSAPHTWLFKQMDELQSNLGFYAFCDYLPPSMLYAYIRDGDMDPLFVSGSSFRNSDGDSWFAQGRYRCTKNTSYVLVPLKPSGGSGQLTTGNFRRYFSTGVDASTGSVGDLMNKALSSQALLSQQPIQWPQVKVEVARVLAYNRFVTLSCIKWTNALTGDQLSLSFTTIGTTLRGARAMRKPGNPNVANGWAKWYEPGSDKNDPSIDSPKP